MKKSMIATAVVATAGLAASANAGYWTISGANYQNGGTNNIAVSQVDNQVNTYVSSTFSGAAGTQTTLTGAEVTSTLSNLGVTLSNNTLTYFGFEDSVAGPGYFGIAFKNTSGSNYYLNLQGGSFAAGGTEGVLTSHSGAVGSGNSWASTGTAGTVVADGTTLLVMFGGLNVGVGFDFQAQSLNSAGTASGATFAISYLNWNGSAYSQVASAATATTSGLNTALYAVPVPAPALLAGAGLVGAAALRRRMAKKA